MKVKVIHPVVFKTFSLNLQTISFETSGTGEVVFETQVVTVTSSYGPDSLSHYRIGLFGVYTGIHSIRDIQHIFLLLALGYHLMTILGLVISKA